MDINKKNKLIYKNLNLLESSCKVFEDYLNDPFEKAIHSLITLLKNTFKINRIALMLDSSNIKNSNQIENFCWEVNSLYPINCDSTKSKNCFCGMILNLNQCYLNNIFTHYGSFIIQSKQKASELFEKMSSKIEMEYSCLDSGFGTIAVIPIRSDEKTLGLLHLSFERENALDLDDIEIIQKICSLLYNYFDVKMKSNVSFFKDEITSKDNMGHLIFSQRMDLMALLSRGIVHKLNNIFGVITMNSEMVKKHGANDVELQKECSDSNLSSIKDAETYLKQILIFGKKNHGMKDFPDLISMIKQCVYLINENFFNKAQFKFQSNFDIVEIHGNSTDLFQMILNILVVSCGSEFDLEFPIEIRVLKDMENVNLEVKGKKRLDSKMDSFTNLQIKEYNLFFSLDIVEEIASYSKWGFSVKEESAHRETVIVFPCKKTAKENEEKQIENNKKGRPSVLVFDDELAILQILKYSLAKEGFDATFISNPEEAFEELKNNFNKYDVLLTDYNMPVYSGIDFAKYVESNYIGIPIIMWSGSSDDLNNCKKYHCIKDVLHKPLNIDRLSKSINKVISEYRS